MSMVSLKAGAVSAVAALGLLAGGLFLGGTLAGAQTPEPTPPAQLTPAPGGDEGTQTPRNKAECDHGQGSGDASVGATGLRGGAMGPSVRF